MSRQVQQVESTLTAPERPIRLQPPLDVLVGAQIGRYVVERRLGTGGMGMVYAATDTELSRTVAIKIVQPRGHAAAMQARLRREAKAMARLSHPNVVPVFDIGTHDGQLFVAMELVVGETLRAWSARPRTWRSVARLFVKAGRGLFAAHAAGLLHRDFKPDNVMVGRGDQPRITDFGLACELDEPCDAPRGDATVEDATLSHVTPIGSLIGTMPYMAPEQLSGLQGGPQADQFSFCVSLFEVLYGTRPFEATRGGAEALFGEIRARRLAKPTAGRGVPRQLHAAIVRGLAFDPEKRWPSMRALVGELERSLRRRRLWHRATFAWVANAAIIVVAAIAAWLYRPGPIEPVRAAITFPVTSPSRTPDAPAVTPAMPPAASPSAAAPRTSGAASRVARPLARSPSLPRRMPDPSLPTMGADALEPDASSGASAMPSDAATWTPDPTPAPQPEREVPRAPPTPTSEVERNGRVQLAQSQIYRVAADHSRELAQCDRGEPLRGEITVDFIVDASGKVPQAQLATAIKKPELSACILRQIQRWRFAKPGPSGAQGRYTLSFQ